MIEFIGVQKKFGDNLVIDIKTFRLEDGVYWLQGINGSGKTTILRMIAGLIPFKGDILIDSVSQRRDSVVYRRKVSWADAEPLYPNFITGKDLVGLYKQVRKVGQTSIDLLIDLFQVKLFLSMPLGDYSSGMVKKLSLLLAFIGEPRLILLDEPLITLDKESIPRVYEHIMSLHLKKKIGFIISSHQELSQTLFPVDRKLLISQGKIQLLQ
jgi:ABC-2 type transport system ATP-binding protein